MLATQTAASAIDFVSPNRGVKLVCSETKNTNDLCRPSGSHIRISIFTSTTQELLTE